MVEDTKTALWVVGETGIGKSTLVRELLLLASPRLSAVPPYFTMAGSAVAAGWYYSKGGVGYSSNRPTGVVNWYREHLVERAQLVVMEGDAFLLQNGLFADHHRVVVCLEGAELAIERRGRAGLKTTPRSRELAAAHRRAALREFPGWVINVLADLKPSTLASVVWAEVTGVVGASRLPPDVGSCS